MKRSAATRYSRYTCLIRDARSLRIIELTKRLAELHQSERNIRAILASKHQINNEAQNELDRTLKTIADLNEQLKRAEAEP